MKAQFSLLVVLLAIASYGQTKTKAAPKSPPVKKDLTPHPVVEVIDKTIMVNVPFDKRIVLIFPSPIKEHNFGNEEIDASYSQNKLYMQTTSTKAFPESNLFVELENGLYYECRMRYYNSLERTTYIFTEEQASGSLKVLYKKEGQPTEATSEATAINSEEYFKKSLAASKSEEYTPDLAVKDRKLIFSVPSYYVIDNDLYFKVRIKNLSSITYDIHSIDFNIVPKKAVLSKDVADPEICKPKYILNEKERSVPAKDETTRIYVFDKFTISDKKKLLVAIWEKGGDREVNLTIMGDQLLKARLIK